MRKKAGPCAVGLHERDVRTLHTGCNRGPLPEKVCGSGAPATSVGSAYISVPDLGPAEAAFGTLAASAVICGLAHRLAPKRSSAIKRARQLTQPAQGTQDGAT